MPSIFSLRPDISAGGPFSLRLRFSHKTSRFNGIDKERRNQISLSTVANDQISRFKRFHEQPSYASVTFCISTTVAVNSLLVHMTRFTAHIILPFHSC
jgi:hypothetical protein